MAERHEWVSKPDECNRCNYHDHICGLCGQDLDHEGWEPGGLIHHTVAYCRPDLVEHEKGDTCTWPYHPDMGHEWNVEHGRPGCYWDHELNKLKD